MSSNGGCDGLGWAESFSGEEDLFDIKSLKGKKLLLTWGRGALARSWNSPQASLLLASRLGMNIEIARPDGYDMDENIYKQVANNCSHNGGKFSVTNHPELGYHGANVVYSRNWISPKAYKKNKFNKQILENKFSFDVDMVDNGEDAVKAIQNKSYQLVLMDIGLPKMNGYEATQAARNLNHNDLLISALTAHKFGDVKEKAKACGMNYVLTKPLTKEKVQELLDELNFNISGVCP